MSRSEVACVLLGMFIPAVLNIEHGHWKTVLVW
jgi:uncharacterized membrane protein